MRKKLPVMILSAALCMTMAPVPGMAAELNSGDAAAEQKTEDLELVSDKKDAADDKKSEVQWTGFQWNSYTEAEVTLTPSVTGVCYYKWTEQKDDGNPEVPEINAGDTGNDEVLISADEDFEITLTDLDTEKNIDLYLQIEDENGELSDLKRLKLDPDSRPEKKASSETHKVSKPKAEDSTVEGLENPLEFSPGKYYDFSVTGAGTDNEDPGEGDVKWVPIYWSTSSNPNSNRIRSTWKIGSEQGITQEGTFNIYVFLRKYVYKKSKWQSTDTIQPVQYNVQSAAVSGK